MDSHQLCKITTAARTPPVVPNPTRQKASNSFSKDEEKHDFEKLPVSYSKFEL